jgi:hypothetical protein
MFKEQLGSGVIGRAVFAIAAIYLDAAERACK